MRSPRSRTCNGSWLRTTTRRRAGIRTRRSRLRSLRVRLDGRDPALSGKERGEDLGDLGRGPARVGFDVVTELLGGEGPPPPSAAAPPPPAPAGPGSEPLFASTSN